MPSEAPGPDDPRRWMDYAQTDLRMAKEGEKNGYRFEPLCYLAQQAAEKALKALFISRRLFFPKTHDLEKLTALLPPDISPPPGVQKARELSEYSEKGRYPHGFEDIGLKEYRQAVDIAKNVVEWVEKVLAREGSSGLFEPRAVYQARKTRSKTVKTRPRGKRKK